jgi:glucose-6-phosphate isomerase
LTALAQRPIDLSAEGVLSPGRIAHMTAEADGFRLLYGTERVTNEVLEALEELAKETNVFDKMQAMQGGEVLNRIEGFPCENRTVLHTAMRDFFDNPQTTPPAKKAAELAKAEVEKLKAFLNTLDQSNQFTDLVQVGIGGSDLGPRALYLAMQAYKLPNRRVHFVSNVDPDDAAAVLKELDLKKTLVVVVSKSGTTLETLTNEEIIRSHFTKANLKPAEHFIAVTGKGSPMDDPNRYLASFYIWDYVGGRYSATSMVGGVMLGFGLGIDHYLEILRGAHSMDQIALKKDVKSNLPLLSALLGVWNRHFLHYPTVAIIPYSQALVRFTAHLQQCDMESNGKHIDKLARPTDFETGPVIWGEPGTNGQHSFYQLIHQGTSTIPLEFIGFKENQYKQDLNVKGTTSQEKLLANLLAQSIALAIGQKSNNPNKQFLGNRPNRVLLAKCLDPYTMGALLSYYENKVAFQGFIWNINSFDQEGVQLGKVLANKIIDQILAKSQGGKETDEFPLGQAMLRHLESF